MEATVGPPWTWSNRNGEGCVKELQDGENTMTIWFRESDLAALRDVFVWSEEQGYILTD